MDSDPRPNKQARIFIELDLISQWATCQRGRVASALVNVDGVILVPARNGTPYGQKTCKELGADPDFRCQYCIHSEKNVINHAARLGVRTEGHNLYCLRRPCLGCANDIVQAGITAVFYREEYDTDAQKEYVTQLFQRANIFFKQVPMTVQEASFNLMLNMWRQEWNRPILRSL